MRTLQQSSELRKSVLELRSSPQSLFKTLVRKEALTSECFLDVQKYQHLAGCSHSCAKETGIRFQNSGSALEAATSSKVSSVLTQHLRASFCSMKQSSFYCSAHARPPTAYSSNQEAASKHLDAPSFACEHPLLILINRPFWRFLWPLNAFPSATPVWLGSHSEIPTR